MKKQHFSFKYSSQISVVANLTIGTQAIFTYYSLFCSLKVFFPHLQASRINRCMCGLDTQSPIIMGRASLRSFSRTSRQGDSPQALALSANEMIVGAATTEPRGKVKLIPHFWRA